MPEAGNWKVQDLEDETEKANAAVTEDFESKAHKELLSLVRALPNLEALIYDATSTSDRTSDRDILLALERLDSPRHKFKEAGSDQVATARCIMLLPFAIAYGKRQQRTFLGSIPMRLRIAGVFGFIALVLGGWGLYLLVFEKAGWDLGECNIKSFWNSTFDKPCIGLCSFDVQVRTGARLLMIKRWEPIRERLSNGQVRFVGETFRCCDMEATLKCCDFLDAETQRFCDNWPHELDAEGRVCPTGNWACLFKIDPSDPKMVNDIAVDFEQEMMQNVLIASATFFLVAIFAASFVVLQQRLERCCNACCRPPSRISGRAFDLQKVRPGKETLKERKSVEKRKIWNSEEDAMETQHSEYFQDGDVPKRRQKAFYQNGMAVLQYQFEEDQEHEDQKSHAQAQDQKSPVQTQKDITPKQEPAPSLLRRVGSLWSSKSVELSPQSGLDDLGFSPRAGQEAEAALASTDSAAVAVRAEVRNADVPSEIRTDIPSGTEIETSREDSVEERTQRQRELYKAWHAGRPPDMASSIGRFAQTQPNFFRPIVTPFTEQQSLHGAKGHRAHKAYRDGQGHGPHDSFAATTSSWAGSQGSIGRPLRNGPSQGTGGHDAFAATTRSWAGGAPSSRSPKHTHAQHPHNNKKQDLRSLGAVRSTQH